METKPYQTVTPYLILNEAEQFIDFTRKVFNAFLDSVTRDESGRIAHAEALIEGSTIMFCQASEQWGPQPAGLFIYVEDVDLACEQALANGAAMIMEPADHDYGRMGGVRDTNGNTWWITGKSVS